MGALPQLFSNPSAVKIGELIDGVQNITEVIGGSYFDIVF